MRRFWGWTIALSVALALALLATLPTPLGFPLWHYNVAFVALAVAGVLAWRALRPRRVATLLLAYSGILATATGFAMLYTKQFPYKEWITWWHSATSFAFLVAFLAHWANNQPRLGDFVRRLLTRERVVGLALGLAWAGVALGAWWTWSTPTNGRFTGDNYLYLSSWAVLGGVVLAYGAWLAFRLPRMRRALAATEGRNRARAAVDASLFLANAGALLTGFALLYFAEPLRAGPLKYVSKWWHTATSVALLALLALHVGFNARLLAAHARRLDRAHPENP